MHKKKQRAEQTRWCSWLWWVWTRRRHYTFKHSLKLANTQDKEAHITSYTLARTNLEGYQNVTWQHYRMWTLTVRCMSSNCWLWSYQHIITKCSVHSMHHSQCLNSLQHTSNHTIPTTVIWTPYLYLQTKAKLWIHDHDAFRNISYSLVKMRYSAKFTILLKFLQTAND